MEKQKIIIIGAGVGGLATAALCAKAGHSVTIIEKNEQTGGRAARYEAEGFTFDMGPSWYLGPDIFEQFYQLIGEDINNHLKLKRLDPAYRIFFKENGQTLDITADRSENLAKIEAIETGAQAQAEAYLDKAEFQYKTAIKHFLYRNYDTIFDFFSWEIVKHGHKVPFFSKMDKYIKKFFKSPILHKLFQYPLVFLGSSPYNTPALYNLMSHMDFNQGVYYLYGGIKALTDSLEQIAKQHGATVRCNQPVAQILTDKNQKAIGVITESGQEFYADIVISNADMHHSETKLLPPELQTYNETYWQKKTLAPSGFILYLGIKGQLPELDHHNLIFAEDWEQGFKEIFSEPQPPSDPSLYICKPTQTEPEVAPPNHENIFVLVPIAAGLDLTDQQIADMTEQTLNTIAESTGISDFKERIVYQDVFTDRHFQERYNSIGGTALGLAHTLEQTALFRPNNVSKKVKNLYYVGGFTNPGIGVPMCIVSAELVYKRLTKNKSPHPLTTLDA